MTASADLHDDHTGPSGHGPAQPVLRVDALRKRFRHGVWPWRRDAVVLRGADLDVGRGQLVGLVRENGSGKSTLMKIVVGLLERDAGTGILIVSHFLSERERLDRVFELRDGQAFET